MCDMWFFLCGFFSELFEEHGSFELVLRALHAVGGRVVVEPTPNGGGGEVVVGMAARSLGFTGETGQHTQQRQRPLQFRLPRVLQGMVQDLQVFAFAMKALRAQMFSGSLRVPATTCGSCTSQERPKGVCTKGMSP